MEKAKFLNLNKQDFWKGLIVAIFGTILSTVGTWATLVINSENFDWSWETLLKVAVVGFIAGLTGYLSKNLFSNSGGEVFKKEKIK